MTHSDYSIKPFTARDPSTLENTLRDINNVQIVVAKDLDSAIIVSSSPSSDTFNTYLQKQNQLPIWQRDTLESIPVSYGRFLNQAKRLLEQGRLKEMIVQREEYNTPKFSTDLAKKILPNCTYVLSLEDAGYSEQLGLTFEAIQNQTETPKQTPSKKGKNDYTHIPQSWLVHCSQVYTKVDEMLNRHYSAWILKFAEKMQERDVIENANDFGAKVESMIRLAALFHDIGKLSKPWQTAIGWKEGAFWGKSQDNKVTNLPPHAFFALPTLRYLFKKLGVVNEEGNVDRLAELIALASARHHSLGSPDGTMAWEPFEYHEGIIEGVHELLVKVLGDQVNDLKVQVTRQLFDHLNDTDTYKIYEGKHTFTLDTPSPSEDYYPFYVLASRIIKVGDWEASGQREVELCH